MLSKRIGLHVGKNASTTHRTPRQVLRAYVEELDITVAGLDEAMEWECWVDDTPSDASDDSNE
jgi:hypothetical protein